jgi:lipopolysaccharide transport system ATP-binding protein
VRPILEIQNLSKRYRLHHRTEGYLTFRERIMQTFNSQKVDEEFWALRDVSFDVSPGESIGIIGRNGAGKSTLLKILSRITPPTHGRIVSRGRIASLLEVGTGFHQELTGRENIYMNGSILGMRKSEIDSRFDEIIDFSGTEKFLDTPLKHYSSGMQLRLAFAVAAHLEPEILIIDEVLAVGDSEFQKKCLGKMEDITGQGRTILFVSHNMGAVKGLCKKAILLDHGCVVMKDASSLVIDHYLVHSRPSEGIWNFDSPKASLPGFLNSLKLTSQAQQVSVVPLYKPFALHVKFTIREEVKHFILGIGMTTLDDFPIRTVWSKPKDLSPGVYDAIISENELQFAPGKYKLIVGLSSREHTFQYVPEAAILEIDNMTDKDARVANTLGIVLNSPEIHIYNHESVRIH